MCWARQLLLVIPTSKEILHNEVLGDCRAFFVSGDALSLAQNMQEIYSQETRRNELEAKALEHSQCFSVAKAAESLESLL